MKTQTEMDRYWQNIEFLRNFIKNLENILFLEHMHWKHAKKYWFEGNIFYLKYLIWLFKNIETKMWKQKRLKFESKMPITFAAGVYLFEVPHLLGFYLGW
jgi:hypothetical protein